MGGKNSKEEVIIAQTASGDATSSLKKGITLSDWLLIILVVLAIMAIVYIILRKNRKGLRRTIRREIYKNELRRSRNDITEEEEQL